jgi:hypothetical protein
VTPADWARLCGEHDAACRRFCDAARTVPPTRWRAPLAAGKWSPAEITAHLEEAYRVLRAELSGGPGMQVVVPPFKRWILRHTVLPRLLRSGRFATGVPAPKETRPRRSEPTPEAGAAALEAEIEGFVAELHAGLRRGSATLTHAYFGPLRPADALRLCTVHIAHHTRQVADASA